MRLKHRARALLFLPLAFSVSFSSCSAPSRRSVTIGAMEPGTSWYVFAATLAGLLEDALPPGARVEIRARGGGVGNPILVERGAVSVALSQAATAAWAYEGELVYEQPAKNIRALVGGLNPVWMTALLTEDYIERTGNDTLEKALRSKEPITIVMKPRGSSVPVFADLVLASFGLTRDDIRERGGQILQVSPSQIPGLLRDGRADLYFESAIRGHPALTEIATTVGVRFLDLPPAAQQRLEGPGVELTDLPKWFPNQARPVAAADMGTVLIARQDLEEDLAYVITKTVCESRDEMVKAHRAWASFEPETAWQIEKTGVPLHPGAERYYRERGWL